MQNLTCKCGETLVGDENTRWEEISRCWVGSNSKIEHQQNYM